LPFAEKYYNWVIGKKIRKNLTDKKE